MNLPPQDRVEKIMKNNIKLQINNKEYSAQENESVLDVCIREKIDVPHLCKHPDLCVKGNCRMCVVEIDGKGVVTSCSTKAEQGMNIKTNTSKIQKIRETNLELIFAQHEEKCPTCIYKNNCLILKLAGKYGLKINKFDDRKKDYPIYQFGDSIQFDTSKCIDCRNCVEVCSQNQTCHFYEISKDKGIGMVVKPKGEPTVSGENSVDSLENDENKFDCTYCGQCIVHCPVGAISEVPHWQDVEELLKNKKESKKILIAQIAPSIRVSIGEEFGKKPGEVVTGQLATSMKKLGFDYAFDVNMGADLTTYEEALELMHWLTSGKKRPMFTSCCPGWVEFVKFNYPEFIPHLTSTNSPIMCSGPIIKTFFADKLKKDPRDIVLVTVVPCTAKKHEAKLQKHKVDLGECIERLDLKNVAQVCEDRSELKGVKVLTNDYVLTTREYAHLLHRHKIDLPNLKTSEMDKPLGTYSGAAVIYGASGGVMESALRSADYFLRALKEKGDLDFAVKGEKYELKKNRFSKIAQSRIKFEEVRGQQGIKTAQVKVGGQKLNIAVVNGLGNARKVLEDSKAGKVKYDYVEVMACPGGCIGGGGQPVPTSAKIRKKRADALYVIDENLPIRTAHENPELLDIYKNYFKGDKDLIEELMHSKYEVKKKVGYKIMKNEK